MIVRHILIVLSFLLLAAHFLRDGNVMLTAVAVLLPALMFIRQKWVPLVIQMALYAGATVWLSTAFSLIQMRLASGAGWLRMALILLAVTFLTIISGLLLNSPIVKRHYQ